MMYRLLLKPPLLVSGRMRELDGSVDRRSTVYSQSEDGRC